MAFKYPKSIYFSRLIRFFFLALGIIFFVLVILAFTTLPFWGYHWLGTSKSEITSEPKAIVLMGGGGMPSPSNLMRSWYAAHAWKQFKESELVIAVPGNLEDSTSTPMKIKHELILRGVKPTKINFENKGTNTRSQALNCSLSLKTNDPILLITSPEHMRRSVLSFQKTGFEKVNALPAFPNALEAKLDFEDDELGGNKTLSPDVGHNLSFRYQVWTHLKYEILILREFAAILYYKLRGWI